MVQSRLFAILRWMLVVMLLSSPVLGVAAEETEKLAKMSFYGNEPIELAIGESLIAAGGQEFLGTEYAGNHQRYTLLDVDYYSYTKDTSYPGVATVRIEQRQGSETTFTQELELNHGWEGEVELINYPEQKCEVIDIEKPETDVEMPEVTSGNSDKIVKVRFHSDMVEYLTGSNKFNLQMNLQYLKRAFISIVDQNKYDWGWGGSTPMTYISIPNSCFYLEVVDWDESSVEVRVYSDQTSETLELEFSNEDDDDYWVEYKGLEYRAWYSDNDGKISFMIRTPYQEIGFGETVIDPFYGDQINWDYTLLSLEEADGYKYPAFWSERYNRNHFTIQSETTMGDRMEFELLGEYANEEEADDEELEIESEAGETNDDSEDEDSEDEDSEDEEETEEEVEEKSPEDLTLKEIAERSEELEPRERAFLKAVIEWLLNLFA